MERRRAARGHTGCLATRGAWPHGLVGHDVDSRRCVAEVRSETGLLAVVLDAGPVPAVLWGKQRPPLRCPAPHMASTDGRGRGDRDELRLLEKAEGTVAKGKVACVEQAGLNE